jgi:phosphatidylinositol alpha-mannosyltransferase
MIKKLKIGLLLDDTLDTPDGVQQYVLSLGAWLTRQGHEVHYLVGATTRQDIEHLHSIAKNIKVRFNKNRLTVPLPTSKTAIRELLDKLNLDVLHVQMPYSPLFAGRVIDAAPESLKIIGTFHIVPDSWIQTVGSHALKFINRHTAKRFAHIISVSTAAQKTAESSFHMLSEVIPNMVSLKAMYHAPIHKKKLHLVFLGRLVERKGCRQLLEALAKLNRQYDGQYSVTIAGKGPLEADLKQKALKLNLTNIKFKGFIDEKDKPALLASADIAVFPSTGGESFGIVLIEAMAAGARVVLGGDNVGYRTVLLDHPDLLVNPKDTVAFANRLHYFMEHKGARVAAHKWAEATVKQYDVEVVCKKIEKLYY